ncbi:Protein mms22 [Rhizoctonia solani]|uniref:Protein mms22 n=1 Tax=Rhizoctonia solani TaxID=456999 RepID=A0A0K6GBB1_9AGAM|nr:Protein mms22 [Rhizoctonia solani]
MGTKKSKDKPREPSLLGKFFGLTPKKPPSIDLSQALRNTADTIRALLDTNPPVRLTLLHKPYDDLSNAASAYRTANVDPLDLTAYGTKLEQNIVRLAGDSLAGNNPLAYLSVLLQKLSSPNHATFEDLELALRVYAEMQPVFGYSPRRDDILSLIRARAMLRQPTEAIEIASALVPPPEPNSDIWPLIACAAILRGEERGTNVSGEIRALIQKMAGLGIEPPPGAWCALLGTLPSQEISAVLKALPDSVSKEPRIWATALEALLEADNEQLRKEVAEKLEAIVGTHEVLDTHVWASLILYVGRFESRGDKNAAYEVLRAFDAAGGLPDSVLLAALLRALPLSERTPSTLRRLENETGVPADERVWGVMVDAALERIGEEVGPELEDMGVMGVWSAAAESGVNLTRNELDKTTSSAVAVELLTDMRQRGIKFPHIAQASNPPPRAVKAGRQTTAPTPLSPLASLTILLMENAPSHEAAFKAYAYACVIDPSSGSFGEREYRAILKAFAGLKVQTDEEKLLREGGADQWGEGANIEALLGPRTEVYAPPPASLYYEIMRDMQRAGYHIQQAEYSTILRAYANTCLAPPDESEPTGNKMFTNRTRDIAASTALARTHNAHVLEHIQRIHTLLKLDTNLTPDVALLNSLMLAYGYAGAIENMLAIWDQMGDGRWDSASVSIVIDALGRSGRANLSRTRKLWDTLRRRHGSRLTVNNYTSWVEALCRLGEFSEAERVVFVDMQGHVRPDEKTLRTLVSFAWRVGRQVQVLEDVRKHFPGVI